MRRAIFVDKGSLMPNAFFAIRAIDPVADTERLNQFTSTRRIVAIEKQFVSLGLQSYWSICVEFLETGGAATGANESGQRRKSHQVDYRDLLTESEFAIYSRLRDYRKQAAAAAAIPVYALFTNEQLAKMVQGNVRTAAGLETIPGVGAAKVAKHGAALLEILTHVEIANEASQSPV